MAGEETAAAIDEGGQDGQQAIDWQAKYEAMKQHSRDWEKRAKDNQTAADELEKLKEAQASEQEKAVKRAEKAEAELSQLKAAAERAEWIARVADGAGVASEVVSMLNGSDEGELSEQVERLLKLLPAYPTRTDDGGGAGSSAAKKTNADRFAEALFGTR